MASETALPTGCRAPSIYEKQVKPVLEAAGLVCKVFTTMHRRHATEIVQDTKPGDYDAVVSLGDDMK
jgi:diacylglycerol kinase family enzyme